jgi:predicted nucleotidyltransferase
LIFKTHMRLSQIEARAIRNLAEAEFGPNTRVLLFGSRTDDSARGGDIDLLVEVQHPVDHPARTAAALAAALSRRLSGRSVDVVIAAPNLRRLPIHDLAARDGVPL